MKLTIMHNPVAMTARNRWVANSTALKKTGEKLSTGYRINRAADDASGLAVSEKLRSQIRGLSKATDNANDGISLIQTADGALEETHSVLQRMRELAVQSANGTYTDSDRQAIQHEIEALKGEITRIADSTEFNEKKLLDGSVDISLTTSVESNKYGARYGSVNENLAIGGGKVSVVSNISGMYLEFTTGASGKGGENAEWCYDYDRTNGDLTQHVKINLVEGQSYTDEQIRKLIDNATMPKGGKVIPGNISFSSEHGIIIGANAETYGLKTGSSCQKMTVDANSVVKESGERYEIWSRNGSKRINIDWNNTDQSNPVSVSGNSISLYAGGTYSKQDITDALIAAGSLNNNNTAQDGSAVDSDGILDNIGINDSYFTSGSLDSSVTSLNVSYSEKYEQKITEYYRTAKLTLTANQYGSYSDYLADEEKYKQPDCAGEFNLKALKGVRIEASAAASEDISCSVNSDELVITLKEGYETNSMQDIMTAAQRYLDDNGYNYHINSSSRYTGNAAANGTAVQVDKFIIDQGSSTGSITSAGKREIQRVGTVAGVRQVIEGSVSGLLASPMAGNIASSDYITFTAETYGSSANYDSLVSSISISTDVGAGEESVEISGERATLHLSTGVEYSDEAIEELLEKSGLKYDVKLTDKFAPDGDKDGYVTFYSKGFAAAGQTVAGEGVGLEGIADISEGITFQIGANGVEDQKVSMNVVDASTKALGVSGLDVSTADNANKAIKMVDKAIREVSKQRSELGALQNRLEHTVTSLTVSNENLVAAESQIRDTDMAELMTKHTNNNILQQASQAMLAQANQQVESVLGLLNF